MTEETFKKVFVLDKDKNGLERILSMMDRDDCWEFLTSKDCEEKIPKRFYPKFREMMEGFYQEILKEIEEL